MITIILHPTSKERPTWGEVLEKNPPKKEKGSSNSTTNNNNNNSNNNNVKNKTEALDERLKQRPSWVQVMDRGVGKDEKQVKKAKEKCKTKLRLLFRCREQKQAEAAAGDPYFELAVAAKPGARDLNVSDGSGAVDSCSCIVGCVAANPGEEPENNNSCNNNNNSGISNNNNNGSLTGSYEPKEINFFNIDFHGPIGGGCYGNVCDVSVI